MFRATLNRAPDLRRLPINIKPRAISLAEGIRAGLSVAVIIAADEYLHFAPLREAALAALLTCMCDPGGPIRRRVPVLLSFTLIGAAITAGFGLLRGLGPAVAVAVGVLGLFCAAFARIYGQAPQQLGALLSAVQILSLDSALPNISEAGLLAAAFIGGGLWATLLTMVIWRTYPYLPARRAVGETYRQLSELVRDLTARVQSPSITEATWEAHARIHRRAVREAIEIARTVVLDTLRSRGAASDRAAQSLIRLETADQLFGELIALSDLLEHGPAHDRSLIAPILRRLRPLLLILGRVVISDDPNAHRRIERAIDAILRSGSTLTPGTALAAVVRQITDRLRIAHTLSVPANFAPGVDAAGRRVALWQRSSWTSALTGLDHCLGEQPHQCGVLNRVYLPVRISVCLICCLLAAACSPGHNLPELPESPPSTYRLGPGDAVRIITFGEDNLTGEFRVSDSGTIALPLVGLIHAAGLSPEDLGAQVGQALVKAKLLQAPSISVEIIAYRPIFVLGEVNKPGQYPYQPGMTVVTAVAVAGGFTYRAITDYAALVRTRDNVATEGKVTRQSFVQPGDVITIFERRF